MLDDTQARATPAEAVAKSGVIPVFVIGSPRSGTTLVGSLIASAPRVTDLQEYAAHYFTRRAAPFDLRFCASPVRERYLQSLRRHAIEFAAGEAERQGSRFYVDSAPSTGLVSRELFEELPHAVFVVCVRHYSGVVQSMTASFARGFDYVGPTLRERLDLWTQFYEELVQLPVSQRVIPFGFDDLCEDPRAAVGGLIDSLRRVGIDGVDLSVFARAHQANEPDRTVAVVTPEGGFSWRCMPSFRPGHLGVDDDALRAVSPESMAELERRLAQRFPGCYRRPHVPSMAPSAIAHAGAIAG